MKKQLLVIYSKALGDTICATPTLRKLYETYNQKISVVTHIPEVFYGNPCVDKIYDMEEYKRYDGFNLPQFNEYDIHTTFGSIGEKYNKIEKKHNVFDIRQFHATELGFMLTPEEMRCEFWPTEDGTYDQSNWGDYVVLHPTNTWPSRTWSKENWIKLIQMLEESNIDYVLIGKDDSEEGFFHVDKKVFDFDNIKGLNLLNKTSLSEAYWFIYFAKYFITMDSGLLHLAGTTDTHIIQLGSSINPYFRAPYRKGKQDYKYDCVLGSCDLHCASNMKYGIKEWGSIQGVPPLIDCLENKPTFECHPTPEQVMKYIDIVEYDKETYVPIYKNKHVGHTDYDSLETNAAIETLKRMNRKKLLYIAPHLSTGGMPKYLERCIELMKDEYDLYLIEYSFYSPDYVVQRNKILEMVDKDKFWSFGMDFGTLDRGIKSEVIDIIKEINPDIIHFQEIPEWFMQYQTADFIYNKDRKWIIIETTHTTTIDLNTKRYFPDKFAHVGNYISIQYKNKFPNIPHEIVEYEPGKIPLLAGMGPITGLHLNPNYKHILNIGIFTPNKGQDYIFKLAEYLQNYKIQFHFLGNQANNFKDYWEPLMKYKPHNCEIHGEVDNVDDWYAECDLFLFPSKLENNPIVLKEAIGWNMPILYKNLEVYDEDSDIKKYDNAIMLTEDVKTDAKLILKILGLE